MQELSCEIDNFYKKLELKWWGLLPWEAISEKLAVKDFFRDLSHATKEAIIAHSSKYSPEEKLAVSCLHGMACADVRFWEKSILQRLHFTPRHSHPWVVDFVSRLQKLVFEHIVKILTCSSTFAVHINLRRTAKGDRIKEQIVKITSYRKLYQLFEVAGDGGKSFKKCVSGKGHVDLIINENKPFVITYNEQKETVHVMCHYGCWNTDGVPQFI